MKYLILTIKLTITFLLIYFAVRNIDYSQTKSTLLSVDGVLVLGIGLTVVLIQTGIAGYKLIPILEIFNYQIKVLDAIKLWFVGNFFSQIMISFVGGDAMRLISLTRSGVEVKVAGRSILLDRVLGFVSLQTLYLGAVFFLLKRLSEGPVYWGLLILASINIIMILGFVCMGYIPQRLIGLNYVGKIFDFVAVSRFLFTSKIKVLYVLLMSCIVQLLNVIAMYLIAILLGASISFFEAFIVGVPVMLFSMLPISIGGWGVRENSMIIGFNIIGISTEIALSVSIILGISLLIGSLPGAVIFWTKAGFFTDIRKNRNVAEIVYPL